jgi:ABC-type dipeptide/oligopeptide/nickel transport system permease subunit
MTREIFALFGRVRKPQRAQESLLRGGTRRFLTGSANRVGLAVLVLGVLAAFIPPWMLPSDPIRVAVQDRFVPPVAFGGAWSHPLGTDTLGRDLGCRLVYAARFTMAVTLLAAALSMLVGVAAGMVAGFWGRWVDAAISRLVDIQMAFPAIFLAVGVLAVAGSSFLNLVFVLAAVDWVSYARVIRSSVLTIREREYVEAAGALGAGGSRILIRHLLPNLVTPIIVLLTYSAARLMLTESALSFLGLGIVPPATTWGGMTGDGRNYLHDAWWVSTVPGVIIAATVLSINFVGDGLRDAFDPQLK